MPTDDLEPRVAALEAQVHKLGERVRANEQDVAAARILAGAADRDTDEFRGELRNFRAEVRGELGDLRGEMGDLRDEVRGELGNLREEFRSELGDFRRATTASFNALREDFTDLRGYVDEQFGLVNGGFIEMRGRFDATAAGQQRIVTLLEGLIAGQG